ncbi:molybdopterin synthase catalytic subunit MoaE [Thalassotalea crassostreae]|uniref:molybdopterin synthase catalytic subunit MoaE n=1 Tax=Thalassotalea crassostreae TaxID=1763536 RepID=UPI0008394EE8|nr:molybdopterin synthase catalytic subunit MoaE [Thalassotalea crassostreae]
MINSIKVQLEDFDFAKEVDTLEKENISDGALVTFVGRVRNQNDGCQVEHLHLEHYAGMTEKCLTKITEQAREKWQLGNISVIHRFGTLTLGEKIVFVGVTSKHRQDAFQAAEFIMDYLKVQAPFWKKELTEHGERWVSAKEKDNKEASKW